MAESLVGKRVRCKECGKPIPVRGAETAADEEFGDFPGADDYSFDNYSPETLVQPASAKRRRKPSKSESPGRKGRKSGRPQAGLLTRVATGEASGREKSLVFCVIGAILVAVFAGLSFALWHLVPESHANPSSTVNSETSGKSTPAKKSADHSVVKSREALFSDVRTLHIHCDWPLSIAFSPDGKRIVMGLFDNTSIICNIEPWETSQTLRGHKQPVTSVAFSPNGKKIVTGSLDKTASIWNAESGEQIGTLRGHARGVTSVAYSPLGKFIVTGSGDKTAIIWNAESRQRYRTLRGHSGSVQAVAFSPDGKQIVTGSADKTAIIWNAQTGEQIRTLHGHAGSVTSTSVAFSSDGKRLVTGSADRTAIIWNAETGKQIFTLSGHDRGISCVAYSPAGELVVTGSGDKTAIIWNASTGKTIQVLKGHSKAAAKLVNAAFSPDGRSIVTASGEHLQDSMVIVWKRIGPAR